MRAASQKRVGLVGAAVLAFGLSPGVVHAGEGTLDDDDDEAKPVRVQPRGEEVSWGVGLRLRQVRLPRSAIEYFVEHAPAGGVHWGYGIELIREKGNFTFSLGVEMDPLSAGNGIWIDKGESIPQDPVDYVHFNDFHWIAADVSFIWHARLVGDVLSLRYGGGLGVGVFQGEILQTDYICTTDQFDSCMQDPNAVNINTPANIPPVFPIVNVVLGLQLRPIKNIAINLEGGIRTVPFLGGTLAVMY